jgi:hypothetical protein
MKPSLARISVLAIAVLSAGACGSAATPEASSPSSTPKLSLAKASARTGAADAAQEPGAMPLPAPVSYVLDGTLPDLGTQSPVYRWTAHTVDIAEVNRLAGVLGIDAPATATDDGFAVNGSNATLAVSTAYGATQISYYPGGNAVDGVSGGSSDGSSGSSSSPPSPGTGTEPGDKPIAIDEPTPIDPGVIEVPEKRAVPVDVPSADAAEDIARALLDRMGVLDGQTYDSEVNSSGGIAVSCEVGTDCSGEPQQVFARDVSFTLVIDGVRVNGIGWNVSVGEHSRIDSLYGEWGTSDVLGTYDLRSTSAAFEALNQGDLNYRGPQPVAVDGDVPVSAQADAATPDDTPAAAPPVPEPNGREPAVDLPLPVDPKPVDTTPVEPMVVHVNGVSLGLARWDAVDGGTNVIDIVPTYQFHTVSDGIESDVEELALDPGAIDFADPIVPSLPVPEPGTAKPEPAPAPDPLERREPTTTPGSCAPSAASCSAEGPIVRP